MNNFAFIMEYNRILSTVDTSPWVESIDLMRIIYRHLYVTLGNRVCEGIGRRVFTGLYR